MRSYDDTQTIEPEGTDKEPLEKVYGSSAFLRIATVHMISVLYRNKKCQETWSRHSYVCLADSVVLSP